MKQTKVTLGVITTTTATITLLIITIAVAGLCCCSPLIIQSAYAQTVTSTITLGEPFFEEKGKITGQKPIGDNRTEVSFSSNGTMKGNIDVTNTGKFWSVSKGNNNLTYGQGQGVITTKDGSEMANYTFLIISNITEEGKPVIHGSTLYSTESSSTNGKLAFLDNTLSVFKAEEDKMGNFASKEWEWK
jgi:hypothetical protein